MKQKKILDPPVKSRYMYNATSDEFHWLSYIYREEPGSHTLTSLSKSSHGKTTSVSPTQFSSKWFIMYYSYLILIKQMLWILKKELQFSGYFPWTGRLDVQIWLIFKTVAQFWFKKKKSFLVIFKPTSIDPTYKRCRPSTHLK